MKFFVLSYNDVCRIVRYSRGVPASEINKAVFGVPYGPKWLGSDYRITGAIAIARDAGFTEAWVNNELQSLELVGASGVN